MNEIAETAEIAETETPSAPRTPKKSRKKRQVRKPVTAKPKVEPDRRVYEGAGEFAGISASSCPAGCTIDRCVISTIGICKHPFKTADNGCGPLTMKNREKARKLIKHQQIDLRG